jgi:Lrp/AsnC family leucine-responsive transcriptional regulator
MSKNLMDDDLNRRLVATLQKEGRISHAELAERMGVSRPTVIDRVKRLEAEGVVAGYSANVSPASVMKPCVAYVAVRYQSGKDDAMEDRFIQDLEREPDVLAAYSTAGEDSLLLKIVAESPVGIHERLRRIKSLGPDTTTCTTVVLKTYFEKTGPSPFDMELPEA